MQVTLSVICARLAIVASALLTLTLETVIVAPSRAVEIEQVIVTSPAASLLLVPSWSSSSLSPSCGVSGFWGVCGSCGVGFEPGAVASAIVHVAVVLAGDDKVTATVDLDPVIASVVVPVNVKVYFELAHEPLFTLVNVTVQEI